MTLPKKVKNEPLIDAVFEIRFMGNNSIADVLPGVLFSKLDGDVSIERLGISEMPKPIRDQDPNLMFAATVRLHWKEYVINIGDRVLGVGCKIPYAGWDEGFKPAIQSVIGFVTEMNLIESMSRYAIRYVNLLQAEPESNQIENVKLSINLSDVSVTNETFALKLERTEDDISHLINITAGAVVTFQEADQLTGLVLDVDSQVNLNNVSFVTWVKDISENLERLKNSNKTIVFNSIQQNVIDKMEPIYD